MRTTLLLAIVVGTITSARASEVAITSPNHARTFAYGEMVWRQLSIDPDTRQLSARITFSNVSFAGGPDMRVDEPFDFRFPGTHYDPTTRTVFVHDRRGRPITVAQYQCPSAINLTAEAKIFLLKESGRVTAILTATSEPRSGLRWIERDNNWSLQNLLTSLCRM